MTSHKIPRLKLGSMGDVAMGTLDWIYLLAWQINFMNVHSVEGTIKQHVSQLPPGLGTQPLTSECLPPCWGREGTFADLPEEGQTRTVPWRP